MKVFARMKMVVVIGVMALAGVMPMAAVVAAEPVYASAEVMAADVPDTNILKKGSTIDDLLKLVVNILLYGLGAAATLGVVIAGVLYLTARDNPQQVARAKMRLIEISIGLAAWAMLFMLLQFLLPGWDGF